MSSPAAPERNASRPRPPAPSSRDATPHRILVAALALVAVQLACDGSRSPTAPPPPPEPLNMQVQSAAYRLLITPYHEERTYPRAAELLVDGESIWAGEVRPPYTYNGYYGPYDVPASVVHQVYSTLEAGTHTLTFRITDQERSPTGYYLSGGVDIYWRGYRGDVPSGASEVENVLNFQDAAARLRTGQEWTVEFVVRDRD